jgi:hypothetical protein
MTEYLMIFGVGFASTFMMGFQSRNVNNGDYLWAAICSAIIGVTNATLWSAVVGSSSGILGGLVYGLSGAIGITASMKAHKRFIEK